MNISRKSFEPLEFKLSETGDITVAFSRFDVVDTDDDVTRAGSMPVGKGVPMSEYGHSSWDGAPPTGKGVISEKSDLGIFGGTFFMETDQGRNAYHTTKAMAELQEWSYGYNVLDGSPITFEGKRVRELRKLDVYEVSPVLRGAGVGTGTLAIKSGAPASGAPRAERLAWHAGEMKAIQDEIAQHLSVREKDGRKLSRSDRAVLEDLLEAQRGHVAATEALLALDTPSDPAKQAMVARAEIDNALAIARVLGVPV